MRHRTNSFFLILGALVLAACATQPATVVTPEAAPAAAEEAAQPAATSSVPSTDDGEAAAAPRQLEPGEQPPTGGAAVGDLLVVPTRIMFEGANRTEEVTLINIGEGRGTYRISLIDYEMTPTGGLTPVASEDIATSAAGMIRYSPRQVTLEPRFSQTIRLQLRKPPGLEGAEYRSHLLFQSIPTPVAREDAGQTEQTEGVRIELRPIFGISIPVIVRQAGATSEAAIRDVTLVRDGTDVALDVMLERKGTGSIYGRLEATWHPAGPRPQRVLGFMSGLAVYPPLTERLVRLPITLDETFTGAGRIEVVFISEDREDRPILARHSLEIR